MRLYYLYVLSFFTVFSGYLVYGQLRPIDFDKYASVVSEGPMPADFTRFTYEKVEEDKQNEIEGLSKRESIDLVKGIHYGIDDILKSGKVVYGDPITNYVSRVGEKIIRDSPDLKEIRFYTLRSNVVNAFCTKQGIVFVTQGLIAQLENEAQLAYILAHEVVHYLNDHIVKGYKDRKQVYKERDKGLAAVRKLSQYSKEKEFEADSIAVWLFSNAGYAKEQVINAFDILAYSYLPFELEDIPMDYLNSERLFIPREFFATEIPKIDVELDYDDSKSSHPNIQQRRVRVESISNLISNWKSNVFLLPEIEFYTVRNMARFESLHNDLYNFRYIDVLYSVFLLEKNFPSNVFITRCKAQAWAGIVASKADSDFRVKQIAINKIQGPSFQLHHLLKSFSKEQTYAIGLRMIYDAVKTFPDDKELNAIFDYVVYHLNTSKAFSKDTYYDKNWYDALEEFNLSKLQLLDTTAQTTEEEVEKKLSSKYDKIRKDKESTPIANSEEDVFPTNKFHLFALSDIVRDSVLWNRIKLKGAEVRDGVIRFDKKEQEQIVKQAVDKNAFDLKLERLMVLESRVASYSVSKKIDFEKSVELELVLQGVIEEMQQVNQLEVIPIASTKYNEVGTDLYNQRVVLLNGISQMLEFPNSRLFPVDYTSQQALIVKNGTSSVGFTFLESQRGRAPFTRAAAMAFLPPLLFIDYGFGAKGFGSTSFSMLLLDLNEFQLKGVKKIDIPGKTNKIKMNLVMYDLLYTLSK